MALNLSSLVVTGMTGVAISMSTGLLLASYVTAGMTPAPAAPPTLARSEAGAAERGSREWRPPPYGPIAIMLAN